MGVDTYVQYNEADHVVVDIETFGTDLGSHIPSIGAVYMNKEGEIVDKFYVVIDTDSNSELGLTSNPSTLEFWHTKQKNENPAAYEAIFGSEVEKVSYKEAMKMFSEWLGNINFNYIWGNSHSFDMGMIEHVLKGLGMAIPYGYRQPRCIRTLCTSEWVNREERDQMKKEIGMISHHALHDAHHEALVLRMAITKMAIARVLFEDNYGK